MSRSYKKHPIMKDDGYAKAGKKFANKKVRKIKEDDVASRSKARYKKHYESWNIHDYVSRWTEEEAIKEWYEEETKCKAHGWDINNYGYHRKYGTLKNFIQNCQKKYYIRK